MLKKTAIATAMALTLGVGAAQAATMTSATFTMLSSGGGPVGVDTTVTGSIGGGTFSVASTTAFFGALWTAHDGVTFGPGTYTIDTIEGDTYTGIVVGAGQVGGHILFDWGTTTNIDVVMVWDVVGDTYTSTDGAGFAWGGAILADGQNLQDGVRGYGMADGAFPGFNANFDFVAPVPVPAAVWLFGSGLLGLVGVARRKKAA